MFFLLLAALGDPNQSMIWAGLGMVAGMCLANAGAAAGTGRSGVGIVITAAEKPEGMFKSILPVIMAGILGIYGLIIAILMSLNVSTGTPQD